MTQDNQIYHRPPAYVDGEPFSNDKFERKLLAERLTQYIDRLNSGCVMAIDAPWGEGKSYFGKNWAAQLEVNGYKTIFLDAFEQDYTDDPFLLISAEILSAVKKSEGDESWVNFRDACVKTGTVLLPAAAKMAANAFGKMVLGINDLAEFKDKIGDLLEEKLGDATEKYIQKRLQDYDQEKQTALHFRESLTEFASKQEKPVVFFIDELDRCKPTFAVTVIERIKHFFDTPNLVFVLLLNRSQLEEAIKGVYGASIDANIYLGKFIQLFLTLPKTTSLTEGANCHNLIYCTELAKRYKYPNTDNLQGFIQALAALASIFGMSLRDLERAFIYFAMAQPLNRSASLGAYMICLKITKPDLYMKVAKDDKAGHIEALELVKIIEEKLPDFWLVSTIRMLHQLIAHGADSLQEEDKIELRREFHGLGSRPEHIFRYLSKKIDTMLIQ